METNTMVYVVLCDYTHDTNRDPNVIDTSLIGVFTTADKANKRVRELIKGERDVITGLADGDEPVEENVTYEKIDELNDGTIIGVIQDDCNSEWEYYVRPTTLDA